MLKPKGDAIHIIIFSYIAPAIWEVNTVSLQSHLYFKYFYSEKHIPFQGLNGS